MRRTGDFVLNVPSANLMEAVVFCGSRSGKTHDKFAECGLTAIPGSKVSSPMIMECPINIECKTKDVISLGSHDLFIAEVLAVHIDESVLDAKGRLDLTRAELFTYLPLLAEYRRLCQKLQ
jgi:flavin reductase (DIM6/NTAB) family NADH-FMN oxidoreductase RutF